LFVGHDEDPYATENSEHVAKQAGEFEPVGKEQSHARKLDYDDKPVALRGAFAEKPAR